MRRILKEEFEPRSERNVGRREQKTEILNERFGPRFEKIEGERVLDDEKTTKIDQIDQIAQIHTPATRVRGLDTSMRALSLSRKWSDEMEEDWQQSWQQDPLVDLKFGRVARTAG